jgi:ParB family chromosome partitioning protein
VSKEEEKVVREIDVDEVIIPPERVTSVFDPEIYEEFLESVKKVGILVPILVMEVDGKLHLIDGLHRIRAAKDLGIKKIKAVVKKGSYDDLLIENIISARLRGKENPAQTAKVVKLLKDKHGYSWADISRKLGMSPGTAKIYYDITRLPEQVLNMIGEGKITVSKARPLLDLPNPRDQVKAAEDIVRYGYNEVQARELVRYYLQAYFEAPVQPKTKAVPEHGGAEIKCDVCGQVFDESPTYYWVHPECMETLIRSFQELRELKKAESEKK